MTNRKRAIIIINNSEYCKTHNRWFMQTGSSAGTTPHKAEMCWAKLRQPYCRSRARRRHHFGAFYDRRDVRQRAQY